MSEEVAVDEAVTLKNRIRKFVPLKDFTTFHIGGSADLFLEVQTEAELLEAVQIAREEGIPAFLMGGGSNLVVSERGLSGLTIRNKSADPDKLDLENHLLTASSGRSLGAVVELAAQHEMTGLETMIGIPGTLGGAIYGNAGAYGKCIANHLVKATLLDPATGRVFEADNAFFRFDYRTSALKTSNLMIINCTLHLQSGDKESIRAQMNDILAQRNSKHPPLSVGSAGSFFKNLPPPPGGLRRRAAGEVLDKAGVKSMTFGGASVFEKHANFIVNYGKATASDVKTLAKMMRDKVIEMFNIPLEEEVLYIGR